VFEERKGRNVSVEAFPQQAADLGQQQGVATEVEEVVGYAWLLDTEQ
jgi:hypothetical protein